MRSSEPRDRAQQTARGPGEQRVATTRITYGFSGEVQDGVWLEGAMEAFWHLGKPQKDGAGAFWTTAQWQRPVSQPNGEAKAGWLQFQG